AGSSPGHTLFRISSTSDCKSGERLLMCRYLGDVHSFHHLITTQHSAYIIDERFPCIPMLKWDHMMQAPPLFCHVASGSAASGQAAGGTSKVLLGSQSSQEITMLQYSGGRVEACSSQGSPQALHRPTDSLRHLLIQIPHRHQTAANRLASPAAGLTCFQKKAGAGECMCVLQLTEAGDIFYQILEHRLLSKEKSGATGTGIDPQPPTEMETSEQLPAHFQLLISDTSSDEDVIMPTQAVAARTVVSETPERNMYSDSSLEESEDRRRVWKRLQVFVNEETGLDQESRPDAGVRDGSKEAEEEEDQSSCREIPLTVSKTTLHTWKLWLQKLRQTTQEKKPHSQGLQHFTVQTNGLLHVSRGDSGGKLEEKLKQDLKRCMSRRSLLLNSSATVAVPDLVPVPTLVNTEAWTDELSDRLTVSWQGEEGWRAWWQDQLGMNRKTKVEALRRRRRREKEARRAAGHHFDLSGSFTTSASYQTDLDDFSMSGWSSAASQGPWSDREGGGQLSNLAAFLENEGASLPSVVQTETLGSILTTTPQRGTPNRPRTVPPTQPKTPETPTANQGRSRRLVNDYLTSLCETQVSPINSDQLHHSIMLPPPCFRWEWFLAFLHK
ncbi:hypothetical protein AMECASPLE_035950, partial [Ameca splendens]